MKVPNINMLLLISKIIFMENIALACQVIVAVSVLYIWTFRYNNIVVEFKHYGY